MTSLLGRIQPGKWELGKPSDSNQLTGAFAATASPALRLDSIGGTPVKLWSSVLGTILLGAFEPGQVRDSGGNLRPAGSFVGTAAPQLSFSASSMGTFTATADPLASFRGLTSPGGFFIATADPLASFTGYQRFGFFAATADPRESMAPIQVNSFAATANPSASYSPVAGQDEDCVTAPPLASTGVGSAPNFVY